MERMKGGGRRMIDVMTVVARRYRRHNSPIRRASVGWYQSPHLINYAQFGHPHNPHVMPFTTLVPSSSSATEFFPHSFHPH